MEIKGYRVGPLLKKTGQEILDDNVLGLAAQTAYYFFFSLFPQGLARSGKGRQRRRVALRPFRRKVPGLPDAEDAHVVA